MSGHQKDKDFAITVAEISKKSFEERKAAERRLAAQASRQLDTVAHLLKTGDVHIRRSLIEILRHMQPSEKVIELLLDRLFNDSDVKARRRAAAVLGGTGNKNLHEHFVKAFEREEHRFVQASIILALGALGFKWTPEWATRCGSQGPVAEAFRKASARSEAAISNENNKNEITRDVSRPPALYIAECYPGLEPFVQAELRMRGLESAQVIEPGWLQIDMSNAPEKKLQWLGAIRTILSTYIIAAKAPTKSSDKLGDFLVSTCRTIKPDGKKGSSGWTFRLELPRMASRAQYRKLVVNLARRLTMECGLRNNPSNYILDIRLINIKNIAMVLWRDTRWEDDRYPEQRLVVPASIHPSVASALCIIGEINSDDIFCDPCCGSGTILAERSSLGPVHDVLGFDISAEAIGISQKNLSRFGDKVKLQTADMRKLPLPAETVNIIVANLPFGIRVGDRDKNRMLYRDFLKEAQRILTLNGRLVAYTQDISAFDQACHDVGWKNIQHITSVEAGGIKVAVYRGIRPEK